MVSGWLEWGWVAWGRVGLFDAQRPGKQFFSRFGEESPLPGYYKYFWV